MRRDYTTKDLKRIRELFPLYGASTLAEELGRTEQAIRLVAWKNGIKRDAEALKAIRMKNIAPPHRHPSCANA